MDVVTKVLQITIVLTEKMTVLSIIVSSFTRNSWQLFLYRMVGRFCSCLCTMRRQWCKLKGSLLTLGICSRGLYLYSAGMSSFPPLCAGVHQWLLLVLLRERHHRWARKEKFLQSDDCGQAGLQQRNWVHSGKNTVLGWIKSTNV